MNDSTPVDPGAQDQRVDEHADQVVECGFAAAGDGVPITTSSVPPSRLSSTASAAWTAMNTVALFARASAVEPPVQVGVDGEVDPIAAGRTAGSGRGRSVGSCDDVGQPGQRRRPVVELPR